MLNKYSSFVSRLYLREMSQIKRSVLPNTPPGNVIWFLTERCNLTCAHCFVSHKERKYRKELNFEQIKTILDTSKGSLKSIEFTGGEPLLHKEFQEVFLYASSLPHIKRLHVSTNGYRAVKLIEVFKKCLEHNTRLSIQTSIDGPEDLHNSIRGNKRAFGDLLELIKLSKDFKSNFNTPLDMVMVMTVSKRNRYAVKETTELAKKYDIPIGINFVRSSSNSNVLNGEASDFMPVNNKDNGLTASEMEETTEEWSSIAKKYLNIFTYNMNKTRLKNIINYVKSNKWLYPCAAGIDDAVIFSDGTISVCETKKAFASLEEYNFDYNAFWKKYHKNSMSTCYCMYDCAIAYSVNKSLKGRMEYAKGFFQK